MVSVNCQSGYLQGKILIANPHIGDSRFERALVFVCTHDIGQAMGIVINHPMQGLIVKEVFEQLDIGEVREPLASQCVLTGGPVSQDRGFVIHTRDVPYGPETINVNETYAVSATQEILQCLVSNQPPSASLFALGYAGWESGQLENEIHENAWLVCDADRKLLFDQDYTDKWTNALSTLGVSPQYLSTSFGHT